MAGSRKYGIISDIHSNYPALKVALDYLDRVGIDKLLCLGDLIGYGAQPAECLRLLDSRSTNLFCIGGNHDRQVILDKDPHMRKSAQKVLEWTADNISPTHARYLKQLPQGMTIDDEIVLVHGSLVDRDAYLVNDQDIAKNLECMVNEFKGMKVCFYGHSHFPMLVGTKAVIRDIKETKSFQLDRNDLYLINPGSVGQPRDKCPLAAFGIFDADRWIMTFVRRPYDISSAQRPIIENGFPEKFARRLAIGV